VVWLLVATGEVPVGGDAVFGVHEIEPAAVCANRGVGVARNGGARGWWAGLAETFGLGV